MVDLSAAYRDVKSLPDNVLQQELSSPSGLIPGYLIMSELQERDAVRAGGGSSDAANQPSMLEEMLGRSQQSGAASQSVNTSFRQYSKGGIIAQLNPFNSMVKAMENPDIMGGYMQEAINNASGGLPALQAASAPGPAEPPTHLSQFVPTPSAAPAPPDKFAMGGLASLYRR